MSRKPEFVLENTKNISVGVWSGTWSGTKIRITPLLALDAPRASRGINVPVIVIVDSKGKVKVYVD